MKKKRMKHIIFAAILALIFSLSAFAQTENPACTNAGISGGSVEAGMPMKFVVTVSGMTDKTGLGYEWTVSAGTIASGQGTCAIIVDTTGLVDGTEITAQVKVTGLPEHCPNTLSKTGAVIVKRITPEMLDEFGNVPRDEVRVRLDAMIIALGQSPNATAYIVSYGTAAEIDRREKIIKEHIAFRKYDANRVVFIRGGANLRGESGAFTRFWILPPGAVSPEP